MHRNFIKREFPDAVITFPESPDLLQLPGDISEFRLIIADPASCSRDEFRNLISVTSSLKEKPALIVLADEVLLSDTVYRDLISPYEVFQRNLTEAEKLTLSVRKKLSEIPARIPASEKNPSENTILVADDSRSIRNFVTKLLTGQGFQVHTFVNGQELLDYLSGGGHGDIILIDNQMPVKDGISTLKEVKTDPVHHDTPVLFLSAVTDKETIVQALELGADDYMEKPFNNNEFFARINVHLRIQNLKKQILLEKEKSDALLLNTLPRKIVEELKKTGTSVPETFHNVTVYFSDIVSFTEISAGMEPAFLISELNEIFTEFDSVMEEHGCERIKTIGDAYMAVSGMPVPDPAHAHNMARASLKIIHYLTERNRQSACKWFIRIGLHSGSVVGGIVGVRKYLYDVFGDTVNTASRMESSSLPMKINTSESVYSLLKNDFHFTERDFTEVKGKGQIRMYFLESDTPENTAP